MTISWRIFEFHLSITYANHWWNICHCPKDPSIQLYHIQVTYAVILTRFMQETKWKWERLPGFLHYIAIMYCSIYLRVDLFLARGDCLGLFLRWCSGIQDSSKTIWPFSSRWEGWTAGSFDVFLVYICKRVMLGMTLDHKGKSYLGLLCTTKECFTDDITNTKTNGTENNVQKDPGNRDIC